MDSECRDLVRRLFALATAVIEDAHELAVRGQSSRPGPRDYRNVARQLREAANNLVALARSAELVISTANVRNPDGKRAKGTHSAR